MSWNNRGGTIDVHRPPYVYNVQVDPQLNPFIPLFSGYAIDCIQSTAGQNEARKRFMELMMSDQNSMTRLVQDLADLTEFYTFSQNLQPGQVEIAIRNAVEGVVNGYLGMAVEAQQGLFQDVLTQEMYNAGLGYANALGQEMQQAHRFLNQGNGGGYQQPNQNYANVRGARGGGGGYTQQPMGRTAGGFGGSRWDEGDQGQQQYQQQPMRAGARFGQNQQQNNGPSNWSHNTGRGVGSGNTIWDERREPARKTDTSFNTGGTRPRREFDAPPEQPRFERNAAPQRQEVKPVNPNNTQLDGQTFFPARTDQEWPKIINSDRIWDWILTQDGTQMRPAALSNWQVAFNPDQPATPWYDSDTHILFHIKGTDGKVREEPLQREITMEYLDHELNPELRKQERDVKVAKGGRVDAAWNLVEQLRPIPSEPLATAEALTDDAEGLVVRPHNPDKFQLAVSLSDAVKRTTLKLKVDKPSILNEAFELYIDRAVLTDVLDPDYELLFRLANAEDFKTLYAILLDEVEDTELLKQVGERMVVSINEALSKNMGMRGWSIDNFREDFPDLLSALEQDYGQSVVDTLKGYAPEIITRALGHYTPKDMAEIRPIVHLEEDMNVLVWRERSSITRLPVTDADLSVPKDTGVLVSPTVAPEVHKTLTSVFERTLDMPWTYHGRYLATSDGVVYTLIRGYLNDQAIMLYKAPFNVK